MEFILLFIAFILILKIIFFFDENLLNKKQTKAKSVEPKHELSRKNKTRNNQANKNNFLKTLDSNVSCLGCKADVEAINNDGYCVECQTVIDKINSPAWEEQKVNQADFIKCLGCKADVEAINNDGYCVECQTVIDKINSPAWEEQKVNQADLVKCAGCKNNFYSLSFNGLCYECVMLANQADDSDKNEDLFDAEEVTVENSKWLYKNLEKNKKIIHKKARGQSTCISCNQRIYNEDLTYFLMSSLCQACYEIKGYTLRWCNDCGLPIPQERVDINPHVMRCINCQNEWERLESFKNKRNLRY